MSTISRFPCGANFSPNLEVLWTSSQGFFMATSLFPSSSSPSSHIFLCFPYQAQCPKTHSKSAHMLGISLQGMKEVCVACYNAYAHVASDFFMLARAVALRVFSLGPCMLQLWIHHDSIAPAVVESGKPQADGDHHAQTGCEMERPQKRPP